MDLFSYLKSIYPPKILDSIMSSLNSSSISALFLNENKMSKNRLLTLYPDLIPHPYISKAFIFNKNILPLGKSIYHELGVFYIQDPSSMMPAFLLDAKPYSRVLDVCSAPGGKTIQTALKMDNKGTIVSNDISISRGKETLSNIERMGIGNVILTSFDFLTMNNENLSFFDYIILDAPCSGSGMLRKDKKMIADWSINKVLKYSAIQKEMIIKAYDLLSPGGKLSYSTCSLSPEENEEVIEYLLKNRECNILGFTFKDDVYVNENKRLGYYFLPGLFLGEGQYVCIIQKPGILRLNQKHQQEEKYHFGNTLFSLPRKEDLRRVNILRYGLKIGEYKGDVFIPSYHFSHFINTYQLTKELTKDELVRYLKGETIPCFQKGFILLTYENIPISFGKADGKIIKNHYPKGLRH